ncbi:MAG: YraN family protein [Phycisphaerae bacterium]|nr:YraN family protein [Phycisphaerae bacterium]
MPSWRIHIARLLGWTTVTQSATRELGKRGEDVAAKRLRSRGYRIIERNAVVPMGEADIVAEAPDGRTVVIVEVKSRRRSPGQPLRSAVTPPEASITRRKRAKLTSIARHLARANGWIDRPVRIDVVAVEFADEIQEPEIRHHEGVI